MTTVLFIITLNIIFLFAFLTLKNFLLAIGITALSLFLVVYFLTKNLLVINKLLNRLAKNNLFQDKYVYLKIIISIFIFFILSQLINAIISLVISVIVFSIFFHLGSRFFFAIAIMFLVLTPLLSMTNYSMYEFSIPTEKAATSAYFFLIVGAIWQIIELTINQSKKQ